MVPFFTDRFLHYSAPNIHAPRLWDGEEFLCIPCSLNILQLTPRPTPVLQNTIPPLSPVPSPPSSALNPFILPDLVLQKSPLPHFPQFPNSEHAPSEANGFRAVPPQNPKPKTQSPEPRAQSPTPQGRNAQGPPCKGIFNAPQALADDPISVRLASCQYNF